MNQSLGDFFRCSICLEYVKSPMVLSCCSKISCNLCLSDWLSQLPECPSCDSTQFQSLEFPFLESLVSTLDSVGIRPNTEKCELHSAALNYYCKTCEIPICADCAILEPTHRSHEYQHLQDYGNLRADQLKSHLKKIRKRLKNLILCNRETREKEETARKNNQNKCYELDLFFKRASETLDEEYNSKIEFLRTHQVKIQTEIQQIQTSQQYINEMLSTSQTHFLKEYSNIINQIQEVSNSQREPSDINLEYSSQIIPAYKSLVFDILHYSLLREKGETLYSKPLEDQGLTWRLKVYPDGSLNTAVSVFIEMIKGIPNNCKHDYIIELVNFRDSACSIVRTFSCEFDLGGSWGFHEFVTIDSLYQDGFLMNDRARLKLSVRFMSYLDLSNYQKQYISHLQNK